MFAKLAEMLRGARRVELMVILALIAVLILASASYDRADAGATALETRLERALEAVKGAGDVRVMITENGDGGVVGVLVVAEGAGDISVRLDIMYAVRTLMGIDADQVEIAQMRGDHK